MRVGTGFDIHRLVEGRPLKLGGIEIAHPKGLLGHSDGDVLLHALADALLGAAALGDIGELFSDTDPTITGLDSKVIVIRVRDLLVERGWSIVNVDATVIAERPKLTDHKPAIRRCIAELLRIPIERVGPKAKTMEKLGPIGRGQAIAAQAVALIEESRQAGV